MNYGISVLFRVIPVLMAFFCFAYGLYVYFISTADSKLIAAPVVFSLGMICIALFCTAATIIRQLIHTYRENLKYIYPLVAYLSGIVTIVMGIVLLNAKLYESVVAGHVVCGVGLITICVATAATSSTRFLLIPTNSSKEDYLTPVGAFTSRQEFILKLIVVLASFIAWMWAIYLFNKGGHITVDMNERAAYLVAGHVMLGLACICTSLIALVATISRQTRNIFSKIEERFWPLLVLAMGTFITIWGVVTIVFSTNQALGGAGYILIGLGMVCYSISSKVILLSKNWKHPFGLSNRIPLIPVFTALACLFLSSFLFEDAVQNSGADIPSRVLAGLGAICFCLFSIVSILESGSTATGSK